MAKVKIKSFSEFLKKDTITENLERSPYIRKNKMKHDGIIEARFSAIEDKLKKLEDKVFHEIKQK